MRNKKGFTLVEILAVISLIGIVMLIVVPNILDTFKSANKSLFQDEVLTLYNNAYSTYIYRSTSLGDYNKRFCVGKDGISNNLEVEDKEDLYYDITVNSYGEVISLKVSNKNYGINLSDINGIKKKNIKNSNISEPFDINCDGSSEIPPETSLICIITDTKRKCRIFNFSYNATKGIL